MSYSATINLEDGQIRFHADERLETEDYNRVREIGLRWKRGQQCFMGPWSPNKVDFLAGAFGIEELDEDGTDLMANAESRAAYYDGYSANASKRSDERYAASNAAVAGIPMGQPILVGHHSESAHRNALKRSWNAMDKSVEESRKSEYWAGRAERTVKAQERKQRPDVISRRIDKLEASLRKQERNADKDRWLAEGNEAWAIHREQDPVKVWEAQFVYANRWIEFLTARIAYQKALYEASGGTVSEKIDFEVGGYVRSGFGWNKIVRVNAKSVTVATEYSWTNLIKYADVVEYMSAADMGDTTDE